MALESRPSADQATALQHIADGGAVVYWRPGCGFCAALDRSLGETGDRALWVNIWEDDAAVGDVLQGGGLVGAGTGFEGHEGLLQG